MRRFVPALLLTSFLGPGCASTRATWADVQSSTPSDAHDDHRTSHARSTEAPEPIAGLIVVDERRAQPAGVIIDRALARFVADRANARSEPRTSTAFGAAWERVLAAIDDANQTAPRASDLGAFVRTRVTLEVELDTDRKRNVLLPADLAARVGHTLETVDERVGELRAANAPGTLAPSARLVDGELILRAPLAPIVVSSPFGGRVDPINGTRSFHSGVDLSAQKGTNVYASAPGLVVYAGPMGGYGRHIVVDHGDGVRTHYSHLSEIYAKLGDLVTEEEPIGAVGSTGRSTGPHLHFAVTNAAGEFIDPLAVLDIPYDSIKDQAPTRLHASLSPVTSPTATRSSN